MEVGAVCSRPPPRSGLSVFDVSRAQVSRLKNIFAGTLWGEKWGRGNNVTNVVNGEWHTRYGKVEERKAGEIKWMKECDANGERGSRRTVNKLVECEILGGVRFQMSRHQEIFIFAVLGRVKYSKYWYKVRGWLNFGITPY